MTRRALSQLLRALRDFLRGFLGLPGAPRTDCAHDLEHRARERIRCC